MSNTENQEQITPVVENDAEKPLTAAQKRKLAAAEQAAAEQITPVVENDAEKPLTEEKAAAETTENENEENPEPLGPTQLRVTNSGTKDVLCVVSRVKIPKGQTVVITYTTQSKRQLAAQNFAQLNQLAGRKYLTWEV